MLGCETTYDLKTSMQARRTARVASARSKAGRSGRRSERELEHVGVAHAGRARARHRHLWCVVREGYG